MDLVHNMLGGDGSYTPDTPIYKTLMAFSAILDSIIDAQPFKNIKKDLLKGYSVSEFMQPMLFNNYIPDNNASFDFSVEPQPRIQLPTYSSHAGEILMTALCLLALPFAKIAPVAAIAAVPAMTIKNKLKNKKHPVHPERY